MKKTLTPERRKRLLEPEPPIKREELWRPEPIAPPVDNLPTYNDRTAEEQWQSGSRRTGLQEIWAWINWGAS